MTSLEQTATPIAYGKKPFVLQVFAKLSESITPPYFCDRLFVNITHCNVREVTAHYCITVWHYVQLSVNGPASDSAQVI